MPLIEPDAFFAELENLGEDEARKRLASGAVYGGNKAPLVAEWIRRKDQERAENFRSEEIEVARRASEAAERAASAAERDAAAAERAADAAERAAKAAEESHQTAKTAKHISMALMLITAISIFVGVLVARYLAH